MGAVSASALWSAVTATTLWASVTVTTTAATIVSAFASIFVALGSLDTVAFGARGATAFGPSATATIVAASATAAWSAIGTAFTAFRLLAWFGFFEIVGKRIRALADVLVRNVFVVRDTEELKFISMHLVIKT